MNKVLRSYCECVILYLSSKRGRYTMQDDNKNEVTEPIDNQAELPDSKETPKVEDDRVTIDPQASVAKELPHNKTITKKVAALWVTAAVVAGGLIGYAGYGSMNNQVVVSGAGMSITKASMTNRLTNSSSAVLYDVAKSEALQQLYPQKVLSSDEEAKKQANKLIDTYIKNNGGETVLNKSLKAQGTTLKKWRASMLPQAIAQVKSQAQSKQALAVVKDAKVVSDKDIDAASKNYKLYLTNAYLSKDEDSANRVADALRNGKDVSSADYSQHQDGLKISSVDNNSDSSDVLNKLKDSKKGDVVVVKLSSGSGYYVFQVKNSYSYADYSKNHDTDGIKQIKKAVSTSLNQQAALSSGTLGKAEAKVFKSKGIHFKNKDLDKGFYSSLTTSSDAMASATTGATTSTTN